MSFVAGGDKERAIRGKSKIPNVFGLGIEEDRLFARRRDTVNLAVGRSSDIECAFSVEGDSLRNQIGGLENGRGLAAVAIEAKNFRGRAACGVERALGVDSQGPEIRGISVGNQREPWRELESAVAANGDAVGTAFQEVIVGSLAPGAGVLGAERRRNEGNDVKK